MALGEVIIEDGAEFFLCETPPTQAELEVYFKENGNGQDHMIMGLELAYRLILQPVDDQKTALLGLVDQLGLSEQEWFRIKVMLFWGLAAILSNREDAPVAFCQTQGMK